MALDTKTMDWTIEPLPAGYEMVVVHSGLTRKLTDGRYAERKGECDAAKRHFGTEDLCLLERTLVEDADLGDVPKRRALHCLSEHQRVSEAVDVLRASNMARFGALMNESHTSMRDQFEVSLPEIDALVDSARKFGALGARLTGGGFGGCIVICVETAERERLLQQLLDRHPKATFVDAVHAG